ncbi:hypothetical protein [Mucilaginibacter flavidus]|uniref:hypothetical protein n=1 Tax=Mucilaginibacter flavidus TaxID=2949309 RepID=UPI002093CEA2|nr:hypothetical protein [Mucilaginibacter flavidus]MCO5947147.1 hypothetical protein [Mucilaginibacter flavidus]
MKISLIHPSRNRAQQACETALLWIDSADNEVEYILSLDDDDESRISYLELFPQQVMFSSNANRSAIDAINNAAKIATSDLLIVISDDFYPFDHWDSLLLAEVGGKADFLMKTQDGIQPELITLPIMDRAYYNRFGYIYHPDYLHMFCDNELTAVGHILGRVITSTLLFEHKHYSVGKADRDALYIRNDNTWDQGLNLFSERQKINFGLNIAS